MTTHYRNIDSPIGPITLAGDGVLQHVVMQGQAHAPKGEDTWRRDPSVFGDAADQLAAYFAGELTEFDLDYELVGTPFQLAVWHALETIPYGETRSYGEVARDVGNPQASRAVGLANGRNPIAIVVPCHRVIGASGGLVGYGGGLHRKVRLLELERARVTAR